MMKNKIFYILNNCIKEKMSDHIIHKAFSVFTVDDDEDGNIHFDLNKTFTTLEKAIDFCRTIQNANYPDTEIFCLWSKKKKILLFISKEEYEEELSKNKHFFDSFKHFQDCGFHLTDFQLINNYTIISNREHHLLYNIDLGINPLLIEECSLE